MLQVILPLVGPELLEELLEEELLLLLLELQLFLELELLLELELELLLEEVELEEVELEELELEDELLLPPLQLALPAIGPFPTIIMLSIFSSPALLVACKRRMLLPAAKGTRRLVEFAQVAQAPVAAKA